MKDYKRVWGASWDAYFPRAAQTGSLEDIDHRL